MLHVNTLNYEVKMRRRRTIAVHLDVEGRVTILAPRHTSEFFIRQFLQKSLPWIARKKDQLERLRQNFPRRTLVTGELFPYLGTDYPLHVLMDRTAKPQCALVDGRLQVTVPNLEHGTVRAALEQWLTSETLRVVQEIIAQIDASPRPRDVRISKAQTRWGSCSPNGRIRFSWRLAMMPHPVLRYVVAHELAHLSVPNHSRKFWTRVAEMAPDVPLHRRWLRQHTQRFFL